MSEIKVNTIEAAKKFEYKDKDSILMVRETPKSEWIKVCNSVWCDHVRLDDNEYSYKFLIGFIKNDGMTTESWYPGADEFIEYFINSEDVTLHVSYGIPFRPLIKGYLYPKMKEIMKEFIMMGQEED